jgi:hypothetical protein
VIKKKFSTRALLNPNATNSVTIVHGFVAPRMVSDILTWQETGGTLRVQGDSKVARPR